MFLKIRLSSAFIVLKEIVNKYLGLNSPINAQMMADVGGMQSNAQVLEFVPMVTLSVLIILAFEEWTNLIIAANSKTARECWQTGQ